MNTISAAPIASGAIGTRPMTTQPTVKTSPKVPMNSVTYLRIVTPAATRSRNPATDHSDTYSQHHLIRRVLIRRYSLHRSHVPRSHHVRQHLFQQQQLRLPPPDNQPRDARLLWQPGL